MKFKLKWWERPIVWIIEKPIIQIRLANERAWQKYVANMEETHHYCNYGLWEEMALWIFTPAIALRYWWYRSHNYCWEKPSGRRVSGLAPFNSGHNHHLNQKPSPS